MDRMRGNSLRLRLRLALVLLAASVAALPSLAAAQTVVLQPPPPPPPQPVFPAALLAENQPHAGSLAIGADFGLYRPDEEFQVGVTPEAFVEFYVTGRWSIRLLGGWARPKFLDRTRSMDHVRVTANVAYNWEHEYWHPFVSAGIGLYAVQGYLVDDTPVGQRFYRVGFNVATGVEYFWSPKIAVKFEFNYHRAPIVSEIGDGPHGFAVTAGLKKYF